jgi:predicted house-cleaning noncanonical NTP pyrophosphatase (MazG superfamily)
MLKTKEQILELIKDLDLEELARLIDQLDYILETKCNKE